MNVLIVDDEPKIRRGLKNLIERICEFKAIVNTARDGISGLEIFNQSDPNLVFVDMKMPNMDGIEFIDRIKKRNPNIIIIIISGYAQFDYAQKAVRYGVMDYLLKPIDPARVAEIVGKAETLLKERKEIDNKYRYIKNNILELREKFLFDIIFETKYYPAEKLNEKYRELELPDKGLCIATLSIQNADQRMSSDGAAFKTDFEKKIHEIINEYDGGLIFSNSLDFYVVLLFVNYDNDREKYLHQLYDTVRDRIRCPIEMEFGNVYTNPLYLPLSYQQSLMRIKNKHYLSDAAGQTQNAPSGINHDFKYDQLPVIIKEAIKYIEQNYSKNIKLADIAQNVYVHPSYLSELFKKEIGQNISDYITNYRIAKAKELLCVFENKVYMVADKVGFNNSRYFGQVFKKIVGMKPVEYREKYFLSHQ